MKVPYYPGCTLKTSAHNFEVSALAVANILGIEMVEIPRWNCCGTVYSLTSDDLMHHIAPVRNLIRVQEMNERGDVTDGNRLLTLCSMCFNTMKSTNLRMENNPEDLAKINDFMYLEKDYDGKIEILHFLEILEEIGLDKITEKVTNPLKDLKISPYYGCMLLRPKEISIDDPEDPSGLERLVLALGAEVVDNPLKKMCCGSYETVQHKDIVVRLAHDILSRAEEEGAEAVITSCPLCAFNLDDRQKEIMEQYPGFKEIPVLYFTQLMAVAFGVDREDLGLNDNYIDPAPLLVKNHIFSENAEPPAPQLSLRDGDLRSPGDGSLLKK